jgi:hypothetical protein
MEQNNTRRRRLTKKQYAFFRAVFVDGFSIADALPLNSIRMQTFHRWLTCPVFMRHLQNNLERCYIQARVEMIRDFPKSIKTVLNIPDKLIRPEEYRRLCTELVRLYSDFGRMERSAKRPSSVVEPARFDALVEQFGVKFSPLGGVQSPLGVGEHPRKAVLQLEKAGGESAS